MKKECENCKYWLRCEGQTLMGECRRYPPVLDFEGKELDSSIFIFPITHYDNWCGEYKIKEELCINIKKEKLTKIEKKKDKDRFYRCVYCGEKIKYQGACDICGYKEDKALGKVD